MERPEITFPSTLAPAEQIAVKYADIIEEMARLIKQLTDELAQYRIVDEEERKLEELLTREGGGQ